MSVNLKEKKRGRPPKNQIQQKQVVKIIEKPQQEEQLVLFLESFDDDSDTNTTTSVITETDKVDKLKKNIKTFNKISIRENLNKARSENNFSSNSDSDDSNDFNHYSDSNNSNKFNYLTETNKNDNSDSEYNVSNVHIDKLLDEIKKRDLIISTLKSKIKDKNNLCENSIAMTKDNKKVLINFGLIQITKNKPICCEKTDLACWWCTYNFDTIPLFLPDHDRNSVYYVFGNFCSFSCMLAYNQNLDDYRKSDRNSLIKQLYHRIFQKNITIKPAGPRELLKKFGGPIDIQQFRDPNYVCSKELKLTIPPMIPLISELEEIEID